MKKNVFALRASATATLAALATLTTTSVLAQQTPTQPSASQFTTTIYGVLDAGVRSSEGLGLSATSSPSANASNTTALASGVDRSGRFGIKGGEDLQGGYKALFTLEGDLYINTGSTNPNLGTGKDTSASSANKLFERQATVGLDTPYGKVLLGRQQSAIRDIVDDIDAINGRFTSFNPNLQYTSLNSSSIVSSPTTYYGTGNPGNDSMMRQDNSVKYIVDTGSVSGIFVYSLGGSATSSQASSSAEAALTYREGPLLLSGGYEELNNVNDTLKVTAYTAGGRLTFGDWQFAASYGSNTADRTTSTQIKTNIASIGTTYAVTPAIDLTLGYYNVDRSWTANAKPEASIKRVIGFVEYKFSPKTLAYLEFDHNNWGGDPTQFQGAAANKSSTTGFTIGLNYKI